MKIKKFQRKLGEFFSLGSITAALFLSEESGEVAKEFKRHLKDKAPVNMEAVSEEMGDVIIALAVLANALGVSLDDITTKALSKWQERKEDENE